MKKKPTHPATPPGKTVTVPQEKWQNLADQAVKSEERRERLLRLAAEFDNYRKRTETEKKGWAVFAESNLLEKLLPVLDSIEQALKSDAPAGAEKHGRHSDQGLKMVLKELYKTLRNIGLEALSPEGQPFDPACADAVEVMETGEYPENTIVKTLRTGYRYRERVLRPAMVAISRAPAPVQDASQPDEENGNNGAGQD